MPKASRGRVLALLACLTFVAGLLAPTSAEALPAAPTGLVTTDVGDQNRQFSWNPVAGAIRYRIQLSVEADFTPLLYNELTYNTSFTPFDALPPGTLNWRVAALDGTGQGNYTTTTFVKAATAGPTLNSPGNPVGGPVPAPLSFPDDGPTFSWNPIVGAKSYILEIDNAVDFVDPTIIETVSTQYTLTTMTQNYDQLYYWRVTGASNANGSGVLTNASETWEYQVTWENPPDLVSPGVDPALPLPVVTDIELNWTAVTGAALYHVQVSTTDEFTVLLVNNNGVVGTRYSPPETLDNGSYFWRVAAIDNGGHIGPWSDLLAFTRGWSSAPVGSSPTNLGFADDPQTFSWSAVDHAAFYEVQVGTNSNFTPSTFSNCYTIATTVSAGTRASGVDPTPGGCNIFGQAYGVNLYWRVRGWDSDANVLGIWSSTAQFQRRATQITLVAPADNATVSRPALDWNPVTQATAYSVHIFDNLENPVHQATTLATSYTPVDVLNPADGPFSWYVAPVVEGIVGSAPSIAAWRSFSLSAPTTSGTVTLVSPAEGASSVEMPAMAWSAVTAADDYRVQYRLNGTVVWSTLQENLPYTGYTHVDASPLNAAIYDWRVQALDGNTVLATSAVRTFEVEDIVAADLTDPITTPENCPPASACPLETSTPTFTWEPVQGATDYLLYIAFDVDFTNVRVVYSVYGNNSFTPRSEFPDNSAGQAYYWHVRACGPTGCSLDPQGATPAVQSSAFQKRSAPVALTSPANGATVVNEPHFVWQDYQASNPSTLEAREYEIQVSTVATFATELESPIVDQPFYTPYGETYPEGPIYWRVRAIDESGNLLSWSETRTLTKSSPPPTMLTPAHNAVIVGQPTFAWTPQTFAAEYVIEIYEGSAMTFSPDLEVVAKATSHAMYTVPDTLPVGSYHWRIRRDDVDKRDGPWSSGRVFTITGIPGPTLVSPAETNPPVELSGGNIIFDWNLAPGAAEYRFQRSASSNFSSVEETQDTVMTRWAPTDLIDPGLWYWRVHALNPAGDIIGTSVTRTFEMLSENRPSAPRNVTVVNGPGSARISWQAPTDLGDPPLTTYKIALTPASGPIFTKTVNANVTTHTFNRLANGTQYAVTVIATNAEGDSEAGTANAQPNGCTGTPFADVIDGHPFCTEIAWLFESGISTGTPTGVDGPILYKPNDAVSRAAMAAFLYRFQGEPAVTLPTQFFADVNSSHPFYNEIQWMAQEGYSTGTPQPSGKPLYKPAESVARQAMAAFLHRLEGGTPSNLATPFFADVTVAHPFYGDIQWMASTGLSTGTSQPSGKPLYKPNDAVARQAMAAFLYRFDDLING